MSKIVKLDINSETWFRIYGVLLKECLATSEFPATKRLKRAISDWMYEKYGIVITTVDVEKWHVAYVPEDQLTLLLLRAGDYNDFI